MTFAMKGNKSPQVRAAFAVSPLEIKGRFQSQANQIVGDDDGMAPQWIADLFANNPHVKQLAINYEDRGVVYSPISSENVRDHLPRKAGTPDADTKENV